jgi:hypothetical protein
MKQVVLPHDPDSPHRVPTRPLKRPPLPEPPIKATAVGKKTPLDLSASPERSEEDEDETSRDPDADQAPIDEE